MDILLQKTFWRVLTFLNFCINNEWQIQICFFFGSQIDIDCACHVLLGIDWDHSMVGNHRKCRLGFYLQILQQTNPFIFWDIWYDKTIYKEQVGVKCKIYKILFLSVSIFFFLSKNYLNKMWLKLRRKGSYITRANNFFFLSLMHNYCITKISYL